MTRLSQERTVKKLLCLTPIGQRRDFVEDLSWSRLGIPAEHLSFVAEDRDAWRLQPEQLSLLPPRISGSRKVSYSGLAYQVIVTSQISENRTE